MSVELKRKRAFEAWARGSTYAEVARETGYASPGAACTAIRIHLDSVKFAAVDEYRTREEEQLRQIRRELWAIVRSEHIAVTGKGVAYDADGNMVLDRDPNIRALAELRKVSESLRKLIGADAPVLTRVENIEIDAVDQDIEALVSQLADNDPLPAG